MSIDTKPLYKILKKLKKVVDNHFKRWYYQDNLIKGGDKPIERYLIYKLNIVIGLLLNGNTQQAIESIKDIIAYLKDYSNK